MILVWLILLVVFFEFFLQLVVKNLRKDFKWLITEADENPFFDPVALDKFINTSFDAELGWCRKPNTSGIEKGRNGNVHFNIDEQASRKTPGIIGEPSVAAFGDSYTFCRQVNDHETWEFYLSQKKHLPVLNFGVGNYGADQALLHYERTQLPSSVKTVILGFVPETICRVQSYWKHYLEFGNTFAFKPRFILKDSDLHLLPNLIRSKNDFEKRAEKFSEIQKSDFFYFSKFRKFQFRFPYGFSLFRAPERNIRLMTRLSIRFFARKFNISNSQIENAPFEWIMRQNIRDAHSLYLNEESKKILRAILTRFVSVAKSRGHNPLIVVFPQMIDIVEGHKENYGSFFKELGLPVLELTEEICRQPNTQALYTEDLYGGHFSPLGNELVANFIDRRIQNENYL